MDLKYVNVIPKDIEKLLNQFLMEHIQLQLDLYNYSFLASELGFSGFSFWLQVQAQDEVLYQRKIMNYLLEKNISYSITNVAVKSNKIRVRNIEEILTWLYDTKKNLLNKSYEISYLAKNAKDTTTVRFFNFLITKFSQELEELKDLHKQYTSHDHYEWDRQQKQKEEPVSSKIIMPFYESN